jgi:hypothetical protein
MNRRTFVALCAGAAWPVRAADVPARAWTLDEVLAQLASRPHDSYLQYVALQLARRQRRDAAVAQQIETLVRGQRRPVDERRAGPELFGPSINALTVQDELQRHAFHPHAIAPRDAGDRPVAVATIPPPSLPGQAWDKLLTGRAVAPSPLSLCVPHDHFFAEFRSLARALELADAADQWVPQLLAQVTHRGHAKLPGDHLKKQLLLEDDVPALRPLLDLVLDGVAITGSDPFLIEGSDVTVLVRLKQPAFTRPQMEAALFAAAKKYPDLRREEGKILGIPYVYLSSLDRSISVVSAAPQPELHIRSTSKAGLERVLAALLGKDANGRAVRRLGETDEFTHLRTIYPAGAPQEDGLVYLSEAFLRRLFGPELQLTERRRLLCYNHLRMIGHAVQLFRSEHGRLPDSLNALAAAGCVPGRFGEGDLACTDAGQYTLTPDGFGLCSRHGSVAALTPCCEIPARQVTVHEAALYTAWCKEHEASWQTSFAPVAIRLQVAARQFRIETLVVGRGQASAFTGSLLGGAAEPLDALPVPHRDLGSLTVRLNKEAAFVGPDQLGVIRRVFWGPFGIPPHVGDKINVVDFLRHGLGNQVSIHLYDATPMIDVQQLQFFQELVAHLDGTATREHGFQLLRTLMTTLHAPAYLAIPVRDAVIVDQFLLDFDRFWAERSRHPLGRWFGIIPEFDPNRPPSGVVRGYTLRLGVLSWRYFRARVGAGLYFSNRPNLLADLATAAPDPGPTGHALLRVKLAHWEETLPGFRSGWNGNSRAACRSNLGLMTSVARTSLNHGPVSADDAIRQGHDINELTDRLCGARCLCPDGGHYQLSPDGRRIICSVHGAGEPKESGLDRLRQQYAGLSASLRLGNDGLRLLATIDRQVK